jgi:hypothetical protein
MPQRMAGLLAAIGAAMLALTLFAHGDLIWMTLVAAAAAIGLAACLARRSTKFSKQHVIDLLNRHGYTQLAEEASRELPDPVDVDRMSAWLIQHGVGFLAPASARKASPGRLDGVLKKPVGLAAGTVIDAPVGLT